MKNRKKRRVCLKKEVKINNIITAHILDISEGGMFIYTQAEFIPGAMLELVFTIVGKEIKAKGSVQHTKPGVGIGIKFINLSIDDFTHLKRFLDCQSDIIHEKIETKNILLVDDNPQSRTIYRNRLLGEGFNTIEASTGTEALRKLEDTQFDLVIIDTWMEGIDGFKFLQIMRLNPYYKMIPVIILSARSTPADFEKAIGLGANDYLVKMTTTPIKLADRVKKLLKS